MAKVGGVESRTRSGTPPAPKHSTGFCHASPWQAIRHTLPGFSSDLSLVGEKGSTKWFVHADPDSGRAFFINPATNEGEWEDPRAFNWCVLRVALA